ncbi:hypothetical protein [Actibacterium sp. 188UL27-1]|uniref:hypothetical protein n=1 Tax=Actibacterium sp. 188UL27-1 TaxID=2786961 RepID=UPI00195BE913|nr:hypothetical protein [Actibacterium sp. 188UL27-1]MBM7067819.1 hypothetical protein [Actibacterium sp. 188UL27-1]
MTMAPKHHTAPVQISNLLTALGEECVKLSELTNSVQAVLWDILAESDVSDKQIRGLQALDTLNQIQMDLAHALHGTASQVPADLTINTDTLIHRLTLHDVKKRLLQQNEDGTQARQNASGEPDLF